MTDADASPDEDDSPEDAPSDADATSDAGAATGDTSPDAEGGGDVEWESIEEEADGDDAGDAAGDPGDGDGEDVDGDAGADEEGDAGADDADPGRVEGVGGAGGAPPAEALLDVADLDAGYGDLQILTGVDLQVGDGEYVTIVGPNGAGKSTVMKSVFGLTNVMGGTVTFDGEDITGQNPEEIIHHGLGYVPQNENVFAGLTVLENLEMGAYILDEVPQDSLEAVFDRFPILEERKDQKAGNLSGGQQQMLAMGRALMLDPDLLLLDEPSAGLAPDLVEEMFDRIDGINDSGTAVLMVEQNAKEALRRCDRGYVLVQGENRFMDEGDALLADEDVRQQFLGG